MRAKSFAAWSYLPFFIFLPAMAWSSGQQTGAAPAALSPAESQAVVERALANELRAAENHNHPMEFHLRKSTPNLTTTKKIIETNDGDVARLLSVNGKPLNATEKQKEMQRLDGLLSNPNQQMHRKQSEDTDKERALKILRALPKAFLYRYSSSVQTPDGLVQKFTFKPNPSYHPSDMETQVLTAMAGQIWINAPAERVVRLAGRVQHGIAFGWGILGHLDKGGTIAIDQANVGDNQWRTTRLKLAMKGRVLFFSKTYDLLEEESHFKPVSKELGYRKAIQMLRTDP